jgi:hypothetical protein
MIRFILGCALGCQLKIDAERDAASHVYIEPLVASRSQPERSSVAMPRPHQQDLAQREGDDGSWQLALMVGVYLVAMFAGLALLTTFTSPVEPNTANAEIMAAR